MDTLEFSPLGKSKENVRYREAQKTFSSKVYTGFEIINSISQYINLSPPCKVLFLKSKKAFSVNVSKKNITAGHSRNKTLFTTFFLNVCCIKLFKVYVLFDDLNPFYYTYLGNQMPFKHSDNFLYKPFSVDVYSKHSSIEDILICTCSFSCLSRQHKK